MVRVIASVTRVASIGRVWLAMNAIGLLRSSTNNKISVCGWCKFGLVCLFVFPLTVALVSVMVAEGNR